MKPSACATARATVDLPAPAGPSMATSMAAATIGHVKLLRPLRERDFALLWTGMTSRCWATASSSWPWPWQVYDLDNDPVALSLVGTAWTLGMVAFLLTGGVVDRPRRPPPGPDRRRPRARGRARRRWACCRSRARSRSGTSSCSPCSMGIGEAFFGPAFGAIVPGGRRGRAARAGQRAGRSSSRQAGGAPGSARRSAGSSSPPSGAGHRVPHRRRRRSRSSAVVRRRRCASARCRGRARPLGPARDARGRSPSCAASRGCGRRSSRRALCAAVLPRPARGAPPLRRAQRPRRRRGRLRRGPRGGRGRRGARDVARRSGSSACRGAT